MGSKTGAFETVITEELDEFEADNLKKYDAVCFLSTTMNVFAPNRSSSRPCPTTRRKPPPRARPASRTT